MRKYHDIARSNIEGLSARQLHERCTVDEEMVENQVWCPWGEIGGEDVRWRGRKTPRSGEFSAEEHSAVQLDSTQDLGECIHSALRTPCKVPRSTRKAICSRKPPEQIMATLGH